MLDYQDSEKSIWQTVASLEEHTIFLIVPTTVKSIHNKKDYHTDINDHLSKIGDSNLVF